MGWSFETKYRLHSFYSLELCCFYDQVLDPDDVAEAVVYILSAKPHVQVILHRNEHISQFDDNNDDKVGG